MVTFSRGRFRFHAITHHHLGQQNYQILTKALSQTNSEQKVNVTRTRIC